MYKSTLIMLLSVLSIPTVGMFTVANARQQTNSIVPQAQVVSNCTENCDRGSGRRDQRYSKTKIDVDSSTTIQKRGSGRIENEPSTSKERGSGRLETDPKESA
ncbi:MAG: hypothetical protein F6J87_13280 [Spirulina sp. SIO3F2]|nr:hypothetical protein [Spirulina sp. SIO3F2]